MGTDVRSVCREGYRGRKDRRTGERNGEWRDMTGGKEPSFGNPIQ